MRRDGTESAKGRTKFKCPKISFAGGKFCTYDHFLPDGDEHYIVNFPFIENEYYYDILLSFGDKCECLEPSHIRAGMKKKTHDLAMIYCD